MLRAVVLTQYRRVTDGQTAGIALASTALAKRRAVKISSWQPMLSESRAITRSLLFDDWNAQVRYFTVRVRTNEQLSN